jgi:hypothetical protein
VARVAIAGLKNQVTQVELAGVLGGGELNAQLLVGVVEDELVVAAALELFGLPAAECGGVALASFVGAGAAPRWAWPPVVCDLLSTPLKTKTAPSRSVQQVGQRHDCEKTPNAQDDNPKPDQLCTHPRSKMWRYENRRNKKAKHQNQTERRKL